MTNILILSYQYNIQKMQKSHLHLSQRIKENFLCLKKLKNFIKVCFSKIILFLSLLEGTFAL